MASILGKAKEAMNSSNVQKRLEQKVDTIILKGGSSFDPIAAAKRFMDILQAEIQSHAGMSAADGDLGATAIASLTQLEHGAPIKVGKNMYQISVSFSDNLHRESLYSSGWPEGVENIAALLNTGYDASKRVYGIWNGKKTTSVQNRIGARFIEGAIRTFMADEAKTYGVVDIKPDDVYDVYE